MLPLSSFLLNLIFDNLGLASDLVHLSIGTILIGMKISTCCKIQLIKSFINLLQHLRVVVLFGL
jgi:hypothetical protein